MLLWTVSALLVVTNVNGLRGGDADAWDDLRMRTRAAFEQAAADGGVRTDGTAIVVGFTGGRQQAHASSSGVVQLRRLVDERYADRSDLTTHAYANKDWRRAADEVVAQVQASDGPPPLVLVYGHSLGGGSVTKFARALGDAGVDVTMAIYIDAVGLRNPRVPGNVQYAVNLYQRGGLLRGFPIRGKSKLVLEDEERTVELGSLRIKPQTSRFGWNWNLVQPIFYRGHIRIGHDTRLQEFVLDVLAMQLASIDDLP